MNYTLAFLAICYIESSNGLNMINKEDPLCVGWTGMRPIAVEDCNRIIKKPGYYKPEDRLNYSKCKEMFDILTKHYLSPNASRQTVSDFWCRGFDGMKNPPTKKSEQYAKKFGRWMDFLEQQQRYNEKEGR